MSIAGLDIGTTGCKAMICGSLGQVWGAAAREYPIAFPKPGWAEQDAELVWERAWEALSEAVAAARTVRAGNVQALALSVQGEAVIPVDAAGRAVGRAMLGMDTRTGAENAWLGEQFGEAALFERTGMPVHTINTLPKLLWLQRNAPAVWAEAAQFLLYEDFLLRRMGGEASISHCLASRTQMYDLAAGTWAEDLLEACGIDVGRLAPLAPVDGGVVGTMRRELSAALGIEGEVLLVSGGHDQACAALGSGVIHVKEAMVSTGTAEVVEVALDAPVLDDALRQAGISVYRHVAPGMYLAMTLNHSGGLLLRWFRDTLCAGEVAEAAESGEDAYDLILADAPEGPTDLLVLPHFSGSGTPWLDTASRGAIVGLNFGTTRATLAKALLEGLTFELRVNLELLRAVGVRISILHAVGGGARSTMWLQMKSDVCHLPLRVPYGTNTACLGAALLAGVAVGMHEDVEEAVTQVVRGYRWRHVVPEVAGMLAYEPRYEQYRRLYPAVREVLGTE